MLTLIEKAGESNRMLTPTPAKSFFDYIIPTYNQVTCLWCRGVIIYGKCMVTYKRESGFEFWWRLRPSHLIKNALASKVSAGCQHASDISERWVTRVSVYLPYMVSFTTKNSWCSSVASTLFAYACLDDGRDNHSHCYEIPYSLCNGYQSVIIVVEVVGRFSWTLLATPIVILVNSITLRLSYEELTTREKSQRRCGFLDRTAELQTRKVTINRNVHALYSMRICTNSCRRPHNSYMERSQEVTQRAEFNRININHTILGHSRSCSLLKGNDRDLSCPFQLRILGIFIQMFCLVVSFGAKPMVYVWKPDCI